MDFKRFYFYCFYLLTFITNAQSVNLKLIDCLSIPKNTYQQFIGVDLYDFLYFTNYEVLTKVKEGQKWEYANYELGTPSKVSFLNPLQVSVFYKETNTLLFLDRFFNETQRINLNNINPSKIALWIENTKNQEVWILNEITNSLEFYNYRNNFTQSTTIPFLEKPVSLTANFTNAYVLLDTQICSFNIYGTKINCSSISDVTSIFLDNNYVIGFNSENKFTLYNRSLKKISDFKVSENNILYFSLKNEKLYIYNGSTINIYQLTISQK